MLSNSIHSTNQSYSQRVHFLGNISVKIEKILIKYLSVTVLVLQTASTRAGIVASDSWNTHPEA